MKREEQIRSAAFYASMTEETIVREEVIKDGVHVGYKDVKLRDSDRPIARLFFMEGVKWADANQPSPWISVEDRLPELGKEVIVSAKDKYIDIDQLADDGEGNYYWWKTNRVVIWCEEDKITHWMPIPEL
jgi:hypothetical protein